MKHFVRIIGSISIIAGLFLFVKLFHDLFNDTLTKNLFDQPMDSWLWHSYAFLLSVPVPFHLMAVGLIIQKKWLAHNLTKIAWYATVASGCWLGISLIIKILFL